METLKHTEQSDDLTLFHGTTYLDGETISIREMDRRPDSLGNGFYTTDNLDAAKLFGFWANKNAFFTKDFEHNIATYGALREYEFGYGNVYAIELGRASILDASAKVNPEVMKQLLSAAGLDIKQINSLPKVILSDFNSVVGLIKGSGKISGNVFEFATKSLGYDALRIKESVWNDIIHTPQHLNIDRKKLATPDTIVIYNADKIKSFKKMQALELDQRVEARATRKGKRRKFGL